MSKKKMLIICGIGILAVIICYGNGVFTGSGLGEYKQARPYMGESVTLHRYYDRDADISPVIGFLK